MKKVKPLMLSIQEFAALKREHPKTVSRKIRKGEYYQFDTANKPYRISVPDTAKLLNLSKQDIWDAMGFVEDEGGQNKNAITLNDVNLIMNVLHGGTPTKEAIPFGHIEIDIAEVEEIFGLPTGWVEENLDFLNSQSDEELQALAQHLQSVRGKKEPPPS